MVPSNRVATQTNFYKSDTLLRTPLRRLRADSIPCLCWRTRGCHGSCRLSFRINHRISVINSDRRIGHSEIQYWIAHASPWSSNPGLCESSVALRILYSKYGFSNLWGLSLETKTYHSGRAWEKHQKLHTLHIRCKWYVSSDVTSLRYSSSKRCGFGATLMYWNHILHLLHPLKVKWHEFKGLKPWPIGTLNLHLLP